MITRRDFITGTLGVAGGLVLGLPLPARTAGTTQGARGLKDLMATRKVHKGCLAGLDGRLWAASSGFHPRLAEIRQALRLMREGNPYLPLYIEGTKYIVLQVEEDHLHVRSGPEGFCIARTPRGAVVVGGYNQEFSAGNANVAVHALADSFR